MCKAKGMKSMVVLFFMAGLFWGCSKTETPTSTTTTVTVSKTAICFIGNSGGLVTLVSDPTADTSLSNATLSWGGAKTSLVFQDKYVWIGYIELFGDADLGYSHQFKDTVLTLTVTSNVGNCQGSMALPDSAYINAPTSGSILPIGSVTCTWATATRAEWYMVYYYAYAYSSYNYSYWVGWKDTITTGNSITLPASYFNYPDAQYYEVYAVVFPYRGPKPQANSTGNMTGTIKGFLVGEGMYDDIFFYVGTPPKGITTPKVVHKEPSRDERRNKYLDAVMGQ